MPSLARRLHLDGTSPTMWLLAVGVAAVVTSLVLNAIGTSILLGSNTRAAQDRAAIRKVVERIDECTTPPQERVPPVKVSSAANDCYVRSLRQQGQAVSTISGVSIVAAACGAAHPGDVPGTRACVEKGLSRAHTTQ